MSRFVRGDFLEVAVESGIEAGVCKVGLGEVLETLSVEVVFKVLQGEGIVEDVGVGDRRGVSTDLLQIGTTAEVLESCFHTKIVRVW